MFMFFMGIVICFIVLSQSEFRNNLTSAGKKESEVPLPTKFDPPSEVKTHIERSSTTNKPLKRRTIQFERQKEPSKFDQMRAENEKDFQSRLKREKENKILDKERLREYVEENDL